VSRYTIEGFRFTVGAETFEFDPDELAYLPSPEQAGAEPGDLLFDVLAAVELANESGYVLEFSDEHSEAVAPEFEAFSRSLVGLRSKLDHRERKLVQAVNDQ